MATRFEDPNLLRLNAMLHRMKRDRCLKLARGARKWVWLRGTRSYDAHLSRARENHFLASWFQHMAEVFAARP